jgi:hypothetical protein
MGIFVKSRMHSPLLACTSIPSGETLTWAIIYHVPGVTWKSVILHRKARYHYLDNQEVRNLPAEVEQQWSSKRPSKIVAC